MSRLLDDEQELEQRDRELTLSTGAILAIFLGLVLLCAVFFGFGYNLGRKSTTIANANVPAETEDNSPASQTNFDNFKSAAPSESKSGAAPVETDNSTPAAPASTPTKTPVVARAASPSPAVAKPGPATAHTPPVLSHTTPASATASEHSAGAPLPEPSPAGAFVVQVAAISHKEDADLLVNALRAKGYTVAAHPSSQDNLLHIQVGPFATRKDAEAMRERLIVDGYNAIVK